MIFTYPSIRKQTPVSKQFHPTNKQRKFSKSITLHKLIQSKNSKFERVHSELIKLGNSFYFSEHSCEVHFNSLPSQPPKKALMKNLSRFSSVCDQLAPHSQNIRWFYENFQLICISYRSDWFIPQPYWFHQRLHELRSINLGFFYHIREGN